MCNFERATRLKLRFGSEQNEITIEELWELNIDVLTDFIINVINELVNDPSNSILRLKLDILKYAENTRRLITDYRLI